MDNSSEQQERPLLGLKPRLEEIIPPSRRPFKSLFERIGLFRDNESRQEIQALLDELQGRREGYEFFPSTPERREMVEICGRTTDYLHDNNIPNIMILDRSARPAYLGIREAWKRKYPDTEKPNMYFVNPTGFVSLEQTLEPGRSGLPKGIEIMFDGLRKGNESGEFFMDARSEEEIRYDFEETYKKLSAEKDRPLFLFDTCIHSGDSIKPVIDSLHSMGFTDVKVGVVGDDDNFSDFQPDFVAVDGTPLGVCYPFDKDRMIDRTFDSVTSRPTENVEQREQSTRLRREISRIFREAPNDWFGKSVSTATLT